MLWQQRRLSQESLYPHFKASRTCGKLHIIANSLALNPLDAPPQAPHSNEA